MPFGRLLLVEDDDVNVEIFQRTARKAGFAHMVDRVRNGREALDDLRTHAQTTGAATDTLVLLDLDMPIMNGFDCLAEIRKDPVLGHQTVIVYTSSANPEDVRRSHALGVAGYFVKAPSLAETRDFLRCLDIYMTQSRAA